MEVDSHAQAPNDSRSVEGFFRLPPELRNAVYEELLVTDCAFRLGYAISFVSAGYCADDLPSHHGPYSHEPRREIFPNILRTCSAIHFEAIAILYGNNSFFLGESETPRTTLRLLTMLQDLLASSRRTARPFFQASDLITPSRSALS